MLKIQPKNHCVRLPIVPLRGRIRTILGSKRFCTCTPKTNIDGGVESKISPPKPSNISSVRTPLSSSIKGLVLA